MSGGLGRGRDNKGCPQIRNFREIVKLMNKAVRVLTYDKQ